MKLQRSLASIALMALIAAAGYFALHKAPQPHRAIAARPTTPKQLRYPPGAPQLAYLRIQPVEEIPEPATEPLPARIAYDEDRTARVSTPIAGRVLQIMAQPGQWVKRGEPLLILDSPDFGGARADAAKAQADLAQKRLAFARAKLLHEGGVLARKDLESAQTDLAQSAAEAERAHLRLRNLDPTGRDAAGEHYVLRAPIAGIVAERSANPGSEVRPDQTNPLFVITDPTQVWAVIDLPERVLGHVHSGQSVRLEVDAYPQTGFEAYVASVGEVLDAATRRIQVRCRVPNLARQLKPEMFARATLLADSGRKVVRISNTALITGGLRYFAFIESQPGVLERREVTVSMQSRDDSIVTAGLKAGERVVTSGALLLNAEWAGGNE